MPVFNRLTSRRRPTQHRPLTVQSLERRQLLAAGLGLPVSLAESNSGVELIGKANDRFGRLPSVAVLTNDAHSSTRDNHRVYNEHNPMRDVIVADIDSDGIDDLVTLSNDHRAIGENVFVELGSGKEIQHSFAPRTDKVRSPRS